MNPLLKKAQEFPRTDGRVPITPVTRDEIDLLLAYFDGEVTVRQYMHAIDKKKIGNATHRIGYAIKKAYTLGWITIKKV